VPNRACFARKGYRNSRRCAGEEGWISRSLAV
jgi:hypothetical protein